MAAGTIISGVKASIALAVAVSPSLAESTKFYATEMAQRVIDQAIQILGGLGVTKGDPAERLYREVRALRIHEGSSKIQKLIIGNQLLR